MDITLERSDLLQLDSISNCGTLKLLPPGKKLKQKLVIADDSGTVGCYEFKKGEPQIVFNNKLFDGPITNVAIGGTLNKRDKIYCSHSQRVIGINKKGKEISKYTSSLTETIKSIFVEDAKIYSGCEYIYNLSDNNKDVGFYLCNDAINGIAVENITKENDLDVALACQDRCVRIISGSQLSLEIPVSGAVTAISTLSSTRSNGMDSYGCSYDSGEQKMKRGSTGVLYGLDSGGIGFIQVERGGKIGPSWFIEDDKSDESSPITCIMAADLTKDGMNEILVGRDDGRVEVYAQRGAIMGGMSLTPIKIFSATIDETVRSVRCGLINSAEHHEVVVASYSGKVISYTTEPVLQRSQDDSYGRSLQTVNNENRIKHLKGELKGLQQKLDKEKEKLKCLGNNKSGKNAGDAASALGAQDFPINSSFILDSKEALYRLSIEVQTSLDMVILRSPTFLDLKDSELGSTVVSIVPPEYLSNSNEINYKDDSNSSNQVKFAATYHCQNGEKRLTIAIRPTEGSFGELSVIVVAGTTPKSAKVLKFPLKPLSLHQKIHILTPEQLAGKRNRVKFSGFPSFGMAHEWLQYLLPDVPPRLAEDIVEAKFNFLNCFTGSITICEINKSEFIIESENLSTLIIAKVIISKMASQSRLRIEENVTVEEETISELLKKIWPRLSYELSLSEKIEIIESLSEIAHQEKDSHLWLSQEYKDILGDKVNIQREYKNCEKSLEYLFRVVSDLYIDWTKSNGIDGSDKIDELNNVIRSNNFQSLLELFAKNKNKKY